MIVNEDKIICTDPLGNRVFFDGASLGLEAINSELSGLVIKNITKAIEKPMMIVKENGKILYCLGRREPQLNYFIAVVIIKDIERYVDYHTVEYDRIKMKQMLEQYEREYPKQVG